MVGLKEGVVNGLWQHFETCEYGCVVLSLFKYLFSNVTHVIIKPYLVIWQIFNSINIQCVNLSKAEGFYSIHIDDVTLVA